MISRNILFVGAANIGKTAILNRINSESYDDSSYTPTERVTTTIKNSTDILDREVQLNLSDTPGYLNQTTDDKRSMSDIDIVVYCIDLSADADIDLIESHLKTFKIKAPKAKLILVGTKSDLCTDEDPELKLHGIGKSINKFTKLIVTSAKDNVGIASAKDNVGIASALDDVGFDSLIDELSTPTEWAINLNHPTQSSVWTGAKNNLKQAILKLDKSQQDKISKHLGTLSTSLYYTNWLDGSQEDHINDFIKNCHAVLKNDFTDIMLNVLLVAIAAGFIFQCAVLAGIIGFGIGVGAGLWSVPALTMGAALAATALIASGIIAMDVGVGVGAGALTAFSIYKKENEAIAPIDEFVEEIKKIKL
jgi:small GTP-binding protein